MRYTIKTENGEHKIAFEQKRWFRKPKERTFVGSGTVWHELPDFKRASTSMEMWLSEKAAQQEYSIKWSDPKNL